MKVVNLTLRTLGWVLFISVVGAMSSCGSLDKKFSFDELRCEYEKNPIFIAGDSIRFSWTYRAHNAVSVITQRKVEVRIAESKEALADVGSCVVSSGRVRTSRQLLTLSSSGLKPSTRYYWQVRLLGNLGGEKLCSEVGEFTTAKLREPWQAKWITDSFDKDYLPSPMFRKGFKVDGELESAYLYISAAGYYDAQINGEPIAPDELLSPAYTHYNKRNLYLSYDVTKLLRSGGNVITATLGNGFYNEYAAMAVWKFEKAEWRARPRMICELLLCYKDGKRERIVSDSSWRTTTGETIGNVIYAGDLVDNRLKVKGWSDPSFDDCTYPAAVECEAPSAKLVAQQMPPIKASQHVEPQSVKRISDREYVFAFPKNMAGVCTLRVKGEKGTRIEMQHGELLKADSTVEMGNIDIYTRRVGDFSFQQDIFILSGEGEEHFTPRFHYNGFQYVTVRADRPIELDKSSLTAHFMHTAVESVGSFACSSELLNNIWRAVRRSYLSNLYGIPTDCPQREKNGWTADAHISMDIALTNFDVISTYEKWIADIVDNQRADGQISGIIPSADWGYEDWIGPVWGAAMFIIPDALYNYYGDARAIEQIYPTAERYLKFLASRETDEGTVNFGLGDWCYYKTVTPPDFIISCYYYYSNMLMAKFSDILGADASQYIVKAESLKQFINKKYLDSESGTYSIGKITAQALPLALGIVPEHMQSKVAERLNNAVEESGYTCDFGLIGSKHALRMLVKYGYVESAYRLATQTRRPSWGNWFENGFTTPLETWAISDDMRDSSANHVFFGDIAAWLHSDLAGINYDEHKVGFENIIIRPHFPHDMDWAEASLRTVRGVVTSAWHRHRDTGNIILEVTLPPNTTATIYADVAYRVRGTGATMRYRIKSK